MEEIVLKEKEKEKDIYHVITIEKAPTPDGLSGTWHSYIIQRGQSKIEGMHRGGLKEVTEHAREYAEKLNERINKTAYTHGTKKKKQ